MPLVEQPAECLQQRAEILVGPQLAGIEEVAAWRITADNRQSPIDGLGLSEGIGEQPGRHSLHVAIIRGCLKHVIERVGSVGHHRHPLGIDSEAGHEGVLLYMLAVGDEVVTAPDRPLDLLNRGAEGLPAQLRKGHRGERHHKVWHHHNPRPRNPVETWPECCGAVPGGDISTAFDQPVHLPQLRLIHRLRHGELFQAPTQPLLGRGHQLFQRSQRTPHRRCQQFAHHPHQARHQQHRERRQRHQQDHRHVAAGHQPARNCRGQLPHAGKPLPLPPGAGGLLVTRVPQAARGQADHARHTPRSEKLDGVAGNAALCKELLKARPRPARAGNHKPGLSGGVGPADEGSQKAAKPLSLKPCPGRIRDVDAVGLHSRSASASP